MARWLILTLILSSALTGAAELRAAELRAGVARVDLTPPMKLQSPLGGYGERMNRPAEGVHDRVFVKALVLSDGERKFALVAADIVGLPPAFKQEVVERLGDSWTTEQMILLPSHSHTSIEMNAVNPLNTYQIPQIGIFSQELFDFTVDAFVKAIHDAGKELVPVRIGTARDVIDGWNRNRRGDETIDRDLTVTRLDRLDGTPLAVLVNFTAHPTFMSGQDMLFSGDWPGHVQRTVEALIGQGVTVMYYNGAEGDQSTVSRPDSGDSRWERAERYGRELGIVVWNVWKKVSIKQNVVFDHHAQAISLPENTWHPAFMETGGAEYGLSEEILREMLPKMYPREAVSVSLRLGDLVIVGVPGEMIAILGRKIKDETARITGAKHPTIGGLADEWLSYILTADEYREGGYEASVSFYGEGLGDAIVTGAVEGVKFLKKESPFASDEDGR